MVQESKDLGPHTNIWGNGINTAQRVLSLCAPSQILISNAYYENFVRSRKNQPYDIGPPHHCTVKHQKVIEVRNVCQNDLGLNQAAAAATRWQGARKLWLDTTANYDSMIDDVLKSGEVVPALAAAHFLLKLGGTEIVRELCRAVGRGGGGASARFHPVSHRFFGQIPSEILFEIVKGFTPRTFKEGDVLCEAGAPAASCFFPVSGRIHAHIPNADDPITIQADEISGEFALWIPNVPRAAKLVAADDGLLLEVHHEVVTDILKRSPKDVANTVYQIVSDRITQNVRHSPIFFPRLKPDAPFPAVCRRYSAVKKKVLDLRDTTYVLFSGRVGLTSPNGGVRHEVTAPGLVGKEEAFGIVWDECPNPDGPTAELIEDVVVVEISHNDLRAIQRAHEPVRNAWHQLFGARVAAYQAKKPVAARPVTRGQFRGRDTHTSAPARRRGPELAAVGPRKR